MNKINKNNINKILFPLIVLAFFACSTDEPPPPPETPKVLGPIEIRVNGSAVSSSNPASTGDTLIAWYTGNEDVSYQWKFNDANVGDDYWELIPEDPGTYTVTVSYPGYPSNTSAPVTVGGTSLPEIPGTLSITVNGAAATTADTGDELAAVYSGGTSVTYRWFKDGVALSTTDDPFETEYTPVEAGSYTVRISAPPTYRAKMSDAVAVTGPTLFVITFDLNGGGYEPPTKLAADGIAIGELPVPDERNGFTFTGWYTRQTGGTLLTENSTFNEATTVYARWNFSGGVPYIDANTLVHENPKMVLRAGSTGTISNQDGTVTFSGGYFQYQFPTTVEGAAVNIDDYAYFIVRFEGLVLTGDPRDDNNGDPNNRSGVSLRQYNNTTMYTGVDSQWPWLTNINGSNGIRFPVSGAGTSGGFSIGYNGSPNGNMSLRITSITFYKVDTHTVTFALDGGDGTAPAPVSVLDGETLGAQLPANPTKANNTFICWKNGEGTIVTAATPIKGDWTLTAQWVLTSELGEEWVEYINAVGTSAPVYGFQLPGGDTFADYDRITVKLTRKNADAFTGNHRLRAWGVYAKTGFESAGNFSATTRPDMGNAADGKLLSSTGPSADNGVTNTPATWASYTITLTTAAKTSQASASGLLLMGIGIVGEGGNNTSTRAYYIKDIVLTNEAGTKMVTALRPNAAALWGDAGKGVYVNVGGTPTRTLLPYEQDE